MLPVTAEPTGLPLSLNKQLPLGHPLNDTVGPVTPVAMPPRMWIMALDGFIGKFMM
jgi:hypothetical protein